MQDPFDPDSFIITANVHILGIEPRIERTLELPVNLNFAQFHEVLQAAFGWTDSHLHRFDVGGLTIGAPEFDDGDTHGPRTIEAGGVRMQDLSFPYGEDASLQALYVYDYVHDWHHRIMLRRRMRDPNVSYPRCIEGVRSGPPEDVGGYSGYADCTPTASSFSNDRVSFGGPSDAILIPRSCRANHLVRCRSVTVSKQP